MKTYLNYKYTGISWIGEIPDHWDRTQIKRVVADKITDGPHETPNFIEKGIPFISAEAIDGNKINFDQKRGYISKEQYELYAKKSKVYLNDILFCKSGSTTGKSALVEDSMIFGIWSPLAIIRSNSRKVFHRYLFTYFQSIEFKLQVENNWSFGTQPNIGMSDLENLWIPIPPLPEQQAIASFLDGKTKKIDTLIYKKQKMIDLLKEQRAALINQAVTKGLNPKVKMKDSGVEWLEKIPAHWEVKRISKITSKLRNGFVGATRDILEDDGIRYLQSLHIKNGEIDFRKPYYVREKWSNEHSETILKKGDVLIVQTGDVGQCAVVTEEYDGCNCHALIIARIIDKYCSGEYLAKYLQSHFPQSVLLKYRTGALLPHLEIGNVKYIEVLLPPIEEQNIIMEHISKMSDRIDDLIIKGESAVELLMEYRTTLISEAVIGKIDVREYQSEQEPARLKAAEPKTAYGK